MFRELDKKNVKHQALPQLVLLGLFGLLAFGQAVQAMHTEIGGNFLYKKNFVDSMNNSEQQIITSSISFYFWDLVSVELSYTTSLLIKKEQNNSAISTSIRMTSQTADVYGTDLVYSFFDKRSFLQPYAKVGVGYMNKTQTTQIDNNPPWTVGPYSGWAPEYGVGLKLLMTEAVAIKMGYDITHTPIDNSSTAQDSNGKIGLSWIF